MWQEHTIIIYFIYFSCFWDFIYNLKMMAYQDVYFNIDHGYLEGLVRGFKSGILKQGDYLNLVQCESLEGELS